MAWPNNLTADERLDAAAAKVEVITSNLRAAIQLFESNRFFVFDRDFDAKIPEKKEGMLLQFLQHTSVRSLVMDTCRLWDRASEDRDSLPTICALIDNPDVLNRQRERHLANSKAHRHLRGENRQILEWVVRISDEDAEKVADERHAALSAIAPALKDFFENAALLARLRDFRDKHIAHSLSSKPAKADLPFFGDAGDLLNLSEPWVEELVKCLCYSNFPWKKYHDDAAETAAKLWGACRFEITAA